jgi:Icc protein
VRTLASLETGETLRLLQITDCHLFADPDGDMYGGNTRQSLMRVLDAASDDLESCHGVLATGDLAQDESEGAYRAFMDLMSPYRRPVLCIPGNHDQVELMRTHLDQEPFQYCGAARGGNWLIVMLSSQNPGRTSGVLTMAEAERLKELVKGNPHMHVLLCLHHQPVNIGSAWLDRLGLENADGFMDQVHSSSNVRGVVWGHVHQAFQSRVGRVHMLAAPSTCHQFVPGEDKFTMDSSRSGYRTLALHADGRIESRIHWVGT